MRRAIVLFVPPPVCEQLDEIRRRWDPVMCSRIGCHITLIHDVTDHAPGRRSSSPPWPPPRRRSRVRLGRAPPTGGSRRGASTCTSTTRTARSTPCRPGWPSWRRRAGRASPFRSHVTLVHSRTTPPEIADAGVGGARGFDPGWPVDVTAIDIVEMEEATGLAHGRALRTGHGGRRRLTDPAHDGAVTSTGDAKGGIDDERGHAVVPAGQLRTGARGAHGHRPRA